MRDGSLVRNQIGGTVLSRGTTQTHVKGDGTLNVKDYKEDQGGRFLAIGHSSKREGFSHMGCRTGTFLIRRFLKREFLQGRMNDIPQQS